MVDFRSAYVGQSMAHSWGIERIEGSARDILPQHFDTKQKAEAEAERLNALESQKNA